MVAEKHYPFAALLQDQRVIPVVALENECQTKGVSEALLAGGIRCIEITLRTDHAIQAIETVANLYPDMLVIAGTVSNASDYRKVCDAGAQAVVSPGVTEELLKIAKSYRVPFVPGVASASEIMQAMQFGLQECKLFPANIVGGIAALNAFAGPFPDMRFCPTGGVSETNFQDYLSQPNVICVGGSWLAPTSAVRNQDWTVITAAAQQLDTTS